jgi:phospholipid N-methyltransferase
MSHPHPTPRRGSKRRFLAEFIRNPGQIGAIAPSSAALARRMLEDLPLDTARVVLEYGPGTGAFTGQLIQRLGPQTRLIAIELSEPCCAILRARHPGLCVRQGSVADVAQHLRAEGIDPAGPDGLGAVDLIVSGLPWAAFPTALQTSILDATLPVLRPGGKLVTFAYHVGRFTPAGRRFARLLPRYFERIEHSRSVWANLPPAFVIRCTKAARPGPA